jgi:hypothetical protein
MEEKRAWDRPVGDRRWISLHLFTFPQFLAAISPDRGVFPQDPAIFPKLHTMVPKKFVGPRATITVATERNKRKPRKQKQKTDDMRNAEWNMDVHRRRAETQGRKERLQKLKLRKAGDTAEAKEEAATVVDRNVAVARAQIGLPTIYIGQYPHGWNMGLGSPAGFSPSSPAMFREPYGHLTPRSRLSSSSSPD